MLPVKSGFQGNLWFYETEKNQGTCNFFPEVSGDLDHRADIYQRIGIEILYSQWGPVERSKKQNGILSTSDFIGSGGI
jgi:hypothetical protein